MSARFLGTIPFTTALVEQNKAHRRVFDGQEKCVLLGFEAEPVITMGVRARTTQDLQHSQSEISARGFAIVAVDRGGQATIHNPGQLVIFPVLSVREMGVRHWIDCLADISRQTLQEWGIVTHWEPTQPGLYTKQGKIMSCGVRIRQGISTHGVAINVANEIKDFSLIRACGIAHAPMDRIGPVAKPRDVFSTWVDKFATRFPS